MSKLLLVLLLIGLFLVGTFITTYRLLKVLSRREREIDPARLRKWDDDDDQTSGWS